MDTNENENNSFKKSFKDFVITMCRNGVQHTQSLQIQATISITIDEKSVEIIQLNEKFYSNEYFPEKSQFNPQELNPSILPRMRGTPRARRGIGMMRRTPQSLPSKFRPNRNPDAHATFMPRRLNFPQLRPQIHPQIKAPQSIQRPLNQNSSHQNIPVICVDEEEDYINNYNTNMKVRKIDTDSYNYSNDVYPLENSDGVTLSTAINAEEMSFNEDVQEVKSELKTESTYETHSCGYCNLEFQNFKSLRTHIRQMHADIRVTSTNHNSVSDANLIE